MMVINTQQWMHLMPLKYTLKIVKMVKCWYMYIYNFKKDTVLLTLVMSV